MGRMNPAKLDRRVTLRERSMTRDDTGTRLESWDDVADIWAELVATKGSKPVTADTEREKQATTWRIRYRAMASNTHRLIYKGKTYEIKGIEETGGRENLLTLETYALDNLP
jgi:SPP1 family predicted phage head-tail adaptor